MTCADVQTRLSAWIDEDVARDERDAVAAHLAGCATCAAIERDLRTIRRHARTLGPIVPPPVVLERLHARLGTDAAAPAIAWTRIAAAVLVVAASASMIVHLARTPGLPSPSGNATPVQVVERIDDDTWHLTMAHYETAITTLESATTSPRTTIDPLVASTLRENLSAVDAAIAASRAAVTASPDDGAARDSLEESLRRKIVVLEAAVAAITDTPKGD